MPLKDPEARKAYLREYARTHKAEAAARIKKWRAENPEARAEHNRKYAEKHPDKVRAKALRAKYKNIDAVRTQNRRTAAEFRNKNPELVKERKAQYAKTHRDVINAAVARRKAAKLQRTPSWLTADHFWMIVEAYDIARKRTELLGFKWHVDHIVPLQGYTVSGLHVPWNLQVIPAVSNLRKGNRWVHA